MRLLAPFALIVGVLAIVIGVDDTPTEADLVFVNQNEVFTLDPQRMSYVQDLRLAHLLYEGLVRWENTEFTIRPGAAALPEVSADGRTYVFRIRPDARWANGHPVTAHDFIYSWKRALLPDTAADYSNLFFTIDGAAEFFEWRATQTKRFAADPFTGDAVSPATVRAMIARLREIMAASASGALPNPIAEALSSAGVSLGTDLAGELDRLERAASVGSAALGAALTDAPRVQRTFETLDATRLDEAKWMWRAAEQRFTETVGIRAVDARTLEVRLRRPTAYFSDLLCFGVFFPVHRPTVEGWEDTHAPETGWHDAPPPSFDDRRWVRLNPKSGKFEQQHNWARPAHHVGNGTHRLRQWRYKRDLRLERSSTFHDQDRIKTDSILALTIEDTNTAVLAFESGRVDWLADVSAEYESDMIEELSRYMQRHQSEIASAEAAGRERDEILASLPPPERGERRNIRVFPTFGTEFYSFNCRPKLADGRDNPFADADVRRAFAMAIDKQTIVDRVTRLREPVLNTLIPPNTIVGYPSPDGLEMDVDRARRTLADAGWTDRDRDGLIDRDGAPFPVIDLLYTTNVPRHKWISLNLKSQWEQTLGVRVQLRPEETKFYRADLQKGQYMLARGRWYGDYGDPTTFLDLCYSTDGNNDRRYASPEFDRMYEAASGESDPEKRMQMLADCERMVFGPDGDTPMLILCQLVQVYMYEPGRVTGLSAHPRLTQFLWQMQVRDR